MPLKILETQDGRGKYYLTEMDYHPTEEEIYAGGWKPPVKISNIYEEYVSPPHGPKTTPLDEAGRQLFFVIGAIDEHGRVTERGLKEGVTQAYVDGTETEKDIYVRQAIQAERFRIANGYYYQDDRRARRIRDY